MLSYEEQSMVNDILLSENASEIVQNIILRYSGLSVENARRLLGLISDVSDRAIRNVAKESYDNAEAAHWLMCQREMSPDTSGSFFASMVPVCKVMFPSGKCDSDIKAKQKYWELFLEQFKNKKVFSWDKDKSWADMYGYTDYLKLVEQNL